MKKEIHQEIKKAIRERGITIAQFENDLGVCKNTINQTFKAKMINIGLVYSIYRGLNLPTDKLDKYIEMLKFS